MREIQVLTAVQDDLAGSLTSRPHLKIAFNGNV